MTDRKYDLLTAEDIDEGRATAAYFLRTEEILEDVGADPEVVAELSAPEGWNLIAGLEDLARLLEGVPVDVCAPPEGAPISGGPVLRIEGPYRAFGRYESSILGFLAHASGIASAAWRVRAAAGDRTVLSFGTRRQHPALGAMIERSALVGGADGIGNVGGGETIGVEAGGTMPHALAIVLGSSEAAWSAFDDALGPDVPRVMLCDTFDDEAEEVRRALGTLGEALEGVRLDTTGSRRGDMRAIVEDVRWELRRHDSEDVDVLVSGGIDVPAIERLRDVADGFGVGGAIADADPIDFSLNVVEVDGDARTKRGVKPGAKTVYREDYEDTVVERDETAPGRELLEPLLEGGEIVRSFDLDDARERARAAIEPLSDRGVFDRER
ncbi:nicotinate phosphoribosyltransferase [Natronomonas sp. F2-12]|jgi:nicotinate phosphoribosyltransferase|uniref:Nicotinate phosphoribosyltransferase n=1 Tax=Natronomonas aquatica TaxID=2841590 RepID=A0A9R1D7Q9_9EURY|nr:nicotinate phosphoribosyltransferase [Natronomonas aquatica]MCQ4334135.1 nicotinate phosphoribosyltransferase [Natronomonas aquatica]